MIKIWSGHKKHLIMDSVIHKVVTCMLILESKQSQEVGIDQLIVALNLYDYQLKFYSMCLDFNRISHIFRYD